jgi:methylthioribose-1-phosphate isomerase
MNDRQDSVRPIRFGGDHLELLDQRVLPHTQEVVLCRDAADVAHAITAMVVRGAPAIGMAAAYGMVLAAQRGDDLAAASDLLMQSRPTAVNLRWALERMIRVLSTLSANASGNSAADALLREAQAIETEDRDANYAMGDAGAAFIAQSGRTAGLYTHCNTGSLATAGYGTALGVVRSAYGQGISQRVTAGETRPWLQGARLTAWELQQDAIPVQLAVEGAAASLMARGQVDWVIVGADRITAQGDTANKIGTYNLAVLAHYHKVNFMVVAHSSTIDFRLHNGDDIPIEERPAHEVTQLGGQQIAPLGTQAVNPAFDVTPHELISVIVTERGVVERPTLAAMAALRGADA